MANVNPRIDALISAARTPSTVVVIVPEEEGTSTVQILDLPSCDPRSIGSVCVERNVAEDELPVMIRRLLRLNEREAQQVFLDKARGRAKGHPFRWVELRRSTLQPKLLKGKQVSVGYRPI